MTKLLGLKRCESPIELQLAEALANLSRFEYRAPEHHEWEIGRWPGWWLTLLAQPQYGEYRFDLGICSCFPDDLPQMPFVIGIEADGHEFHEKTREQVARDKRRDRFVTATEGRLFRFSGSEIYKDAEACAYEVMTYAIGLQQANLKKHFLAFVKQGKGRKR